jgi:Protein of unknown function (DUF2281)
MGKHDKRKNCRKIMTIDLQIFQTVVKMPESLKQEILHNAKYLLEKHAKTELSPEQLQQPHGYGSWAGQIFMSDDFDAPLEDLKEYM